MKKQVVVKIKTLWEGKVAVKSQAIIRARSDEKDLKIIHKGGSMLIPCEDIVHRIILQSKEYICKFTGKPYTLYYFWWSPDIVCEQIKLF